MILNDAYDVLRASRSNERNHGAIPATTRMQPTLLTFSGLSSGPIRSPDVLKQRQTAYRTSRERLGARTWQTPIFVTRS